MILETTHEDITKLAERVNDLRARTNSYDVNELAKLFHSYLCIAASQLQDDDKDATGAIF